jgi:hypothetical protein
MSEIISEENYVIDIKRHEDIKFPIGVKPSDYNGKIRESLIFREILSRIWFEAGCLETKKLLEDAIESVNNSLISKLNISAKPKTNI